LSTTTKVDELEAYLGEDAAKEFTHRTARILLASRNAMQQMDDYEPHWILEFDKVKPEYRKNLMGWYTNPDTISDHLRVIEFPTKEAAIQFAQDRGIKYRVVKESVPKVEGKSYAANFKWRGEPKS
jgi:NADH dehydrogenase (ubiquinone) Fe-S protein 4